MFVEAENTSYEKSIRNVVKLLLKCHSYRSLFYNWSLVNNPVDAQTKKKLLSRSQAVLAL